jgi:glycosyltransferase involved in cell wall biosynthesis
MTLLWFNLSVDREHQVLAFGLEWIRLMADKFDRIVVLTMEAGEFSLPPNVTVHSVGREKGYSRPRRFFRFYLLLFRILRREKIDEVFAHMNILFAAMAGPFLKIKRIPLFLWHAHRSVTTILRIAVFFSRSAFTSTAAGLRLSGHKRTIVGQGIDTNLFRPDGETRLNETLLYAGRISPIKNVHILVEVVDDLVRNRGLGSLRLIVAGEPLDLRRDRKYLEFIKKMIRERGLGEYIVFPGKLDRDTLVKWYQRAVILLNLSDTGSLDKVLLEAMACGCIPVSSNESFRMLYEQKFPRLRTTLDPGEIASKVQSVLSMGRDEKERLRIELRDEVIENHSLKRLIDVISGYLIRENE